MNSILASVVCWHVAQSRWPPIGPSGWGRQRDNVWSETGIVGELPAGGPKVAWRAPVAGGYAGPAVAGGKVYVADYVAEGTVKVANFERKEFTGNERVLCLDEATGKELWKHQYPVKYTISYPAGPRCTPAVSDGKVYTLGAEGNLFALGRQHGQSPLVARLQPRVRREDGPLGLRQPSAHGRQQADLHRRRRRKLRRRLRQEHGQRVVEESQVAEQGYSPPSILKIAGQRQLVLAAARRRDRTRPRDRQGNLVRAVRIDQRPGGDDARAVERLHLRRRLLRTRTC